MLKNATSWTRVSAVLDAARRELAARLVEQRARLLDFRERDDEREHDAHVAVHRGTQKRAQLRAEQLRLVEAHPNRPPPEEGVRLGREAPDGELVTADVERADDHRLSVERLDDTPVRAVLLFLVGHRRAPDDEELGAHEPHAHRSAGGRLLRLVRQVDVRAQRDGHAVARDRLCRRERPKRVLGLDGAALAALEKLDLGGCGVEHERPAGAVEQHPLVAAEAVDRVAEPHDGGKPEGASEDGDVRGAGAQVRGDTGDRRPVQLHRQARGEIVGDEDRVRAARHVDRVVVGQPEEHREEPDVDVDDVAHALAHHRLRRVREGIAPHAHRHVGGLLGAHVVPDE
jgi:hypothetical protein